MIERHFPGPFWLELGLYSSNIAVQRVEYLGSDRVRQVDIPFALP